MPDCSQCGAPIRWVEVEGEGRIPLDTTAGDLKGPHRYRLVGEMPGQAERIPLHVEAYGYLNHRESCPSK
jgi:hypothetical protein